MGDATLLSGELISILNQQGVFYLYQAIREPRLGLIGTNWITSVELGLEGSLAAEWQDFHCAILNNGVQLMRKLDELIWTGGDSSGRISVKLFMKPLKTKNKIW